MGFLGLGGENGLVGGLFIFGGDMYLFLGIYVNVKDYAGVVTVTVAPLDSGFHSQ